MLGTGKAVSRGARPRRRTALGLGIHSPWTAASQPWLTSWKVAVRDCGSPCRNQHCWWVLPPPPGPQDPTLGLTYLLSSLPFGSWQPLERHRRQGKAESVWRQLDGPHSLRAPGPGTPWWQGIVQVSGGTPRVGPLIQGRVGSPGPPSGREELTVGPTAPGVHIPQGSPWPLPNPGSPAEVQTRGLAQTPSAPSPALLGEEHCTAPRAWRDQVIPQPQPA